MEVEIYKYDSKVEIPKFMNTGKERTSIQFELKTGGTIRFEINNILQKENFLVSSTNAREKRTELATNNFLLVKESLGREFWEKNRYYCIADKKINAIQTESVFNSYKDEAIYKIKSLNLFQRIFMWKKYTKGE